MKIETSHQESLQCLCCAAYQELGEDLTTQILWRLMYNGQLKIEKHEKNDIIWDNAGIEPKIKDELVVWAKQGQKNDREEKYINKSF